MKIKETLLQALAELAGHKLRTLLTLLGMIFGVGAVNAMLNIGSGAEQEALRLIDTMGVRNLIVQSRQYDADELKEIRKHSIGLSLRDLEAARITLGFIERSSAEKQLKTFSIYSATGESRSKVMGVTDDYFALSNLKSQQGRMLNADDNQRYAQVAVLGGVAARKLFPQGDAVGKKLKVNHLWLEVVGVLASPNLSKKEFQGIKLGGESDTIFLPLSTVAKRLNVQLLEPQIDSFRVRVDKDVDQAMAAKALTHLLKKRHGDLDDFTIIIPSALLAQHKQTQNIFNIVMASVAGISLLVGGIGIMNIMLATILERTKEIGLYRAVGATRANIMHQFLMESFVISLIGGILGVVFGLVLSEAIALYSGWPLVWSMTAIVSSLVICMIIGIVFGIYPAKKASRLDPIEALHAD
ncbi:MAG: putative ABC transport system permease protein [Alteromonadaceae bacterium]|jgi:putative ABC transport system permease protein